MIKRNGGPFAALFLVFAISAAAPPSDPYYGSSGSWGQDHDDQWAIKRVGFTADDQSAWERLGPNPQPVVVAIIDTGLDWNHLDINWKNIWRNENEVPDNGIDDDQNGHVDDIIGWDFFADTNSPWDHDGHGTFVAGVIAANFDNSIGIAGINPYARIMVLKALNSFGHTRASYLAQAILYAADNGARIINMSTGGPDLTEIETAALDYALSKGLLVVVAAGNEGTNLETQGRASHPGVITVAATGFEDERAGFSNWGPQVSVAAPGLDILSLRARRTDLMRDIEDVEYENSAAYVGEDRRYYRASGTSFSAPVVTGIASLILSKDPDLTADEVKRMILQSARDIEIPGVDELTGYGLVDARSALTADPSFFVEARITELQAASVEGTIVVRILGTADASEFGQAWIEIGPGENPADWQKVSRTISEPVREGILDDLAADNFTGFSQWVVRLIVEHANGARRESRFTLSVE